MPIDKFGQRSLVTWTAEDLRKEREAEIQMSRELKFRAWDKVAKKFLHPYPDGFHILGETTCFDLIGMQLKERNPEKTTLEMLNDVVIEQFTGLKDKNGTEIYEGDIVQHLRFGDKRWQIGEVIWAEEMAAWLVKHWYNKAKSDKFWSTRFEEILLDEIEIIGNIHTTPELMEQENG